MSRSITIAVILFLLTLSLSCKKKTVAPAPIGVPWNLDSLMPTLAAEYASPSYLNVSGVMIASNISGGLVDSSGDTNLYIRNWEAALFLGEPNTFTGGVSAVSVNNTPLHTGISEYYDYFAHHDSAVLWNSSASNHWNVTGSSSIPSISTDISGTMPAFSGILPTSIFTATDFSFTFNSSNTANADSAYAVIYTGGTFWYSNVVSANGGTAIISASKMSYCHNGYVVLTGFQGDTGIYYGGMLMIVIYNHEIQTFSGKQFAFVKQKEILSIVKFL